MLIKGRLVDFCVEKIFLVEGNGFQEGFCFEAR